jgi:gliding motility-associated-like protein
MKVKFLYALIMVLFTAKVYSQQSICADSSFRIKYIFGNTGASLFNNPDTTGKNIFTGEYKGAANYGIALLRTTWGDSMLWAKKIYSNGVNLLNENSFPAPNGTIICTGVWGLPTSAELLISKIDTNGNVQWIKRFRLNSNHLYYKAGNFIIKNVLVANNAIYCTANFNGDYDVIAKLDLDGNIIWSRHFYMNTPIASSIIDIQPAYANGSVYVVGYSGFTATSVGLVNISKLNDTDGSIIEAFGYKVLPDTLIKGYFPQQINYNTDNSFSISGFIGVDIFGTVSVSNTTFNTRVDANLTPIHNYYYTDNIPLGFQQSYFDFNNQKQHAYLSTDIFKLTDKYFITFGKNDEIIRSRKLVLPVGTFYRNSLNFDDKQNLHFVYQYDQAGAGSKIVNEYSRISNLAPNSTLGCFGKDTSILTQVPFTLVKEPFVWDNTVSNVITSNDVPYTEDTAIVTKELVCKIVSLCNNIKINGPAAACVGVPVRYTVSKNNGCFKNLDWFIDTTAASIVSTEGDSAITLKFKKIFTGYIRAALTDCVVKDSFLVKAVLPLMPPLINRKDSLLCPGKTLTLIANTGYTSYLWQNNTAGQQFTVNSTGVYTITALDSCGATRTDSIRVTLADTTLAIPATQTICLYDTAFITLPNDVNNITWQPTGNSLLNNKTLLLYPQQTTIYTINAGRSLNCTTIKTTTVVIKNCPQTIFIPNSFTPNNDTRNDVFKPIISQPLAFYRFAIYNRYGQTIFETSNQQLGWGGTFKGSRQPQGGYIYQCSYRFAGTAVQKNVNGYFLLLR